MDDSFEAVDPRLPPRNGVTEVKFTGDVTSDELPFDWDEFYAYLRDHTMWFNEKTFVSSYRYVGYCDYRVTLDEGTVYICVHNPHDTLTNEEIAERAAPAMEFLIKLAATRGDTREIELCSAYSDIPLPLSGATLTNLLAVCEKLEMLKLVSVSLEKYHCEALATVSRTDCEVLLRFCRFKGAGMEAFVECVRRNRGPTEMKDCFLDYVSFAEALRGNTRVKKFSGPGFSCEEMDAFTAALAENKGLVKVFLWYEQQCTGENWTLFCNMVRSNTTLQEISLIGFGAVMLDELKRVRTTQFADALHFNSVLQEVNLRYGEYDKTIFQERIVPRLEMNKTQFEEQRKTLRKVHCPLLKAKLLARALYTVKNNHDLALQILTENLDAVCRDDKKPKAKVVAKKRKRAPEA